MKNSIKYFGTLISKFWTIYGGIAMSTLFSWIVDFSKPSMDTFTSYLVLTLACVSVLTFLKITLSKKKPKGILEHAMLSQNSIKAMNIAVNPIKVGKEIGETIVETLETSKKAGTKVMKKIKKFFKHLWLYRQQIIGLIGAFIVASFIIYIYIEDKFGWLLQYLPEGKYWEIGSKIFIGFLSITFLYYIIRNQVKWVGWGSIKKAEEYLNKTAKETMEKLSPEGKSLVKKSLVELKNKYKQAKICLNKTQIEFEKAHKNYKTQEEVLKTLIGISETSVIESNQIKLNELNKILTYVSNDLQDSKQIVEKLETQISEYEKVLNNN